MYREDSRAVVKAPIAQNEKKLFKRLRLQDYFQLCIWRHEV